MLRAISQGNRLRLMTDIWRTDQNSQVGYILMSLEIKLMAVLKQFGILFVLGIAELRCLRLRRFN